MNKHHSFAPVSVRRRLGYFTEVADRLSEGKAVSPRRATDSDLLGEFSPSHLGDRELAPESTSSSAPGSDA